MSLEFPWAAFMEAQRQKNQNRQDMNQNIAGMGQGFNTIGQAIGEYKKKQIVDQLVAAMKNNGAPAQGPQMPTGPAIRGPQGYVPPGSGPSAVPSGQFPMPLNPTSGIGAPAQDNTALIDSLKMQYDPESALRNMPTPLQQSEIAKNQAQTRRYQQMSGGPGGPGPGKRTVYEKEDGSISLTPVEGATPMVVSDAQAMQYTGVPQSSKFKQEGAATKSLDSDWKEVRKVINPFRSTGIGGASSVFNKAAVANQAAARGLKILNKPSLTWQELNAYVNSDIASIQRGGTPTDIQLHEANYSTLLGKVGSIKTYLSGKPSTGLVPPETRKQIEENIKDIIQVDNQIIDDGIGYVEQAYPEAIGAHAGTWRGMKAAAEKIKTVGGDTVSSKQEETSQAKTSQDGWSYVGPAQ